MRNDHVQDHGREEEIKFLLLFLFFFGFYFYS